VSTTPTWGIEPTTSSLGAMSPYHQAKACGHTHSKMLFHNEVQEAKVAFVGFSKYVFWRSLVARLDLFN